MEYSWRTAHDGISRSEQSMTSISSIFARFQNLNLVFLIEDLRRGLTARGSWLEHANLCPVAHGMPDGDTVEHLEYINHARNLDAACTFAARALGARAAFPRQVEALRLPIHERRTEPCRYLRSQARTHSLSQHGLRRRHSGRLQRPARRQLDADSVHVSQVRPIRPGDQQPVSAHL